MTELTEQMAQEIKETHDKVIRMHQILVGNGTSGLVDKVEEQGKRIHKIELILAASGILTATILGAIRVLGI